MSDMTFVELFAGVGGMSRGLEMAGWRCVGHAEWDDHARAVLRRQWPEVPLWGDVSQLNGHDLVQEVGPFTMLTFGAPCQDFSIAGKRSGMDGERSVLVLDALRIWEESQAPFALYENVVGMLSSNKGEDFAAILSVFVGDAVAVPARGWRGGGGVVRGRRGVAAWRVLDAQYFGVPQRRRRVFVLGTRTGSLNPAEVLALLEGVSGHPATRRAPRQSAAADTGRGAQGKVGSIPLDVRNATRTTDRDEQNRQGLGIGEDGDPSPTLTGLFTPAVLTYDARGNGEGADDSSLTGDHQNRVTDYTAIVLRNREGKPDAISFDNRPHISANGVTETLTTEGVRNPMSVVMRQREGKPGGGKGPLLSPERERTLGTANDQVVFPSVSPTVTSKWAKGSGGPAGNEVGNLVWWNGSQVADALTTTSDRQMMPDKNRLQAALQSGVPRRLTPVECERLMGWPDGWTAQGLDAQGRPYALSDTARYKACGNGVASPVAAWIGFRLREALTGGSWEVTDA